MLSAKQQLSNIQHSGGKAQCMGTDFWPPQYYLYYKYEFSVLLNINSINALLDTEFPQVTDLNTYLNQFLIVVEH